MSSNVRNTGRRSSIQRKPAVVAAHDQIHLPRARFARAPDLLQAPLLMIRMSHRPLCPLSRTAPSQLDTGRTKGFRARFRAAPKISVIAAQEAGTKRSSTRLLREDGGESAFCARPCDRRGGWLAILRFEYPARAESSARCKVAS